jgi:hydrogenase maturation protease
MTALVAGIGNLFFGDDAFGVEVARRLAADPPSATAVTDFGIRALHLAFELCKPYALCVVADCVARGGEPGTLYVIEPDVAEAAGAVADAHGMDLRVVFSAVREFGGVLPEMIVVGCEPGNIDEGIGLSEHVARAIPSAAELIRDLVVRRTGKDLP